MTKDEIKEYENIYKSKDNHFSWNNFISTSLNYETAKDFSLPEEDNDKIAVIFSIELDLSDEYSI